MEGTRMAWGVKVEDCMSQYKDAFTGECKLDGQLHLEIDQNVQPVQLTTRRVPIVFREPLKQELDRLSDISLIRKVDSPTEWISAVVITTKKNGQVRLCIDPKPLNEALRRNRYPLPTIDDVLPLLSTARVFTLLDAKNGFWHVQLDIIDITLEGLPGQKAIADNTDEGALEGHDRNLGGVQPL